MNVLCVGSHSDDLEIGVGGTAARLAEEGEEVDFLLICNLSRIKDISQRLKEAEKASEVLGVNLIKMNLQEGNFRDIPRTELVYQLDEFFSRKPYRKVFVPCFNDSHSDHKFCAEIIFSVCRKNTADLFMYESAIPSGIVPNSFVLNYFVDISNNMFVKMKAVRCHKSQIEVYGEGWLSAIEARARFWGEKFKKQWVEAFQAVKIII